MGNCIGNSNRQQLVLSNMFWSSNKTQDGLVESLFYRIPDEIIIYIFRFLSVPDLCNVSLVCRTFKIISDQDEIWKEKCKSKFKIFLFLIIIN